METGRRAVVEEQDATWTRTRSDGCMWAFVNVDQMTAEAWTSVARRGELME